MDPILLSLIKSMQGKVDASITSALSGVESYTVDGLNLTIKLADGTEQVMEFPEPVSMDDVSLEPDANDKVHLIVTLEDGTRYDAGEIPAGLSAFQIAQKHGFSGDEQEWLNSLPGRISPVRFDFDVPNTEWRIQHNLNNKYITLKLYDDENDEIANAVIERYSPNLAIAHFDIPVAGYAIAS